MAQPAICSSGQPLGNQPATWLADCRAAGASFVQHERRTETMEVPPFEPDRGESFGPSNASQSTAEICQAGLPSHRQFVGGYLSARLSTQPNREWLGANIASTGLCADCSESLASVSGGRQLGELHPRGENTGGFGNCTFGLLPEKSGIRAAGECSGDQSGATRCRPATESSAHRHAHSLGERQRNAAGSATHGYGADPTTSGTTS